MNIISKFFTKSDEMDLFFKKILNKHAHINRETLREFKILFVQYGSEKIELKFYQLFPLYQDYQLSILLVFFYLVINWNKVKQIRTIYEHLRNNKLFHLGEDRQKFHDINENRCYFFNKMFIEHLIELSRDAKLIFAIKQELTKSEEYVEHLVSKQIGFEGLHFYLKRISKVMRILNVLWKLSYGQLDDKNKTLALEEDATLISVFDYIIEALSKQMFLEYKFIKNCLSLLLPHLREDHFPLFKFLNFYKDFSWKNKEMISLVDKHFKYYKDRFIKLPTIYTVDQDEQVVLNQLMAENSEEVDQERKEISLLNWDQLSFKALMTLEYNEEKLFDNIDNQYLHSQHSILNKIGGPILTPLRQQESIGGRDIEKQSLNVHQDDVIEEEKNEDVQDQEENRYQEDGVIPVEFVIDDNQDYCGEDDCVNGVNLIQQEQDRENFIEDMYQNKEEKSDEVQNENIDQNVDSDFKERDNQKEVLESQDKDHQIIEDQNQQEQGINQESIKPLNNGLDLDDQEDEIKEVNQQQIEQDIEEEIQLDDSERISEKNQGKEEEIVHKGREQGNGFTEQNLKKDTEIQERMEDNNMKNEENGTNKEVVEEIDQIANEEDLNDQNNQVLIN